MKKHNSTNGSLLLASAIAMTAASFPSAQISAQQTVTLPTGAVNVAVPGFGTPVMAGVAQPGFQGFQQTGFQVPTYSPVNIPNQQVSFGGPTVQTYPSNVQTSAYTGPVYNLPSVNSGQQLPPETLNGPVVTSVNTPLPAPQPMMKAVVAPTIAMTAPVISPTIVKTPMVEPKVADYTAGPSAPYFVIKGMGQKDKSFTWDSASTVGTGGGKLLTDMSNGRTILGAIGAPMKLNLPIKGLNAEAELGYRRSKVKSMSGHSGNVNNPSGEVRIFSGALNLIKEFDTTGRLGAYVGAGLGIAELRHKNFSGTYAGKSVAMTRDEDIAFMSNIIGGLEYALSEKTSLIAEIRQVNFSDIDRNANNGGEMEDGYSVQEGGLGLKINF